MKILAIIPARVGSKGVPKKNIKILGDKPLIVHAINCAIKSDKVSRIIVSTDSDEIATIAVKYGSEIIKRPENLADDNSSVVNAVLHVLNELKEDFDLILLLQPTSPLRTTKDLDAIISMFEEDSFLDSVISVVSMDDLHPARMYNLGSQNELLPFIDYGETARRQDLDPVYFRNGCFYAIKTSVFLRAKSFMVKNKKAYLMDANWLANIDTPRDFKIAEILYEDWKNENPNN